MLTYIKNLLPKPVVLIYSAILPLIVSIYVFVDRSVTGTVNNDGVDYFSFADNELGLFLIDQTWQMWIARALDFVMWGFIGGVFLLIFWIFSASRVAIHNHKVQEEFVNFKLSRSTWHGHFVTVAFVKVIILFLILYCLGVTIFIALPGVIQSASNLALNEDWNSISRVLISSGSMIIMQYLLVLGIKVFNMIHVDD